MRTVEEINQDAARLQAKAVLLNAELKSVTAREELFAQLEALGMEKKQNNPNDIFLLTIGHREIFVHVSNNAVEVSTEEHIFYPDQDIESAGTFIAGVIIAAKENAR